MDNIKVGFMIPTYHRTDCVIKFLQTLDQAEKGRVTYAAYFYAQDASEEDQKRLAECITNLTTVKAQIVFAPKVDKLVIGHIRNLMFNAMPDRFEEEADLLYMVDDDIWFTDDISDLSAMLTEFHAMDEQLCYVRSFKNRKMKLAPVYSVDTAVPTAPSTDLGIVFNTNYNIDWLFDNVVDHMSVGEDIYYMIKTLAMGEEVLQLTGCKHCIDWDDDWLSNTGANGGGIHEIATEMYGNSPVDMVKRNELLSRGDGSYVQLISAYAFHYEAAVTGFRRFRPNLVEWLNANTVVSATNLQLVVGADLMEFDDSHRRTFGLDKVDYVDELPKRHTAFWERYNQLNK